MMASADRPLAAGQTGMALMIVLVFTTVLTLLVVGAINTGRTNLRIAGNQQAELESRAAAQMAIESALGTLATFTNPAAAAVVQTIDIDRNGTADYAVTLEAPTCLSSTPAPGYSYLFAASAPLDTIWTITATATDTRSGASASVRQGVRVRLPAGSACPN